MCMCASGGCALGGRGDAALPAHAGACQQLDAARGSVAHERRLHRQQDGSRGPSPVAPGTPVAVPRMHQQVQACAQIVVLQTVRVRHCVRGFVYITLKGDNMGQVRSHAERRRQCRAQRDRDVQRRTEP